MIPRSSHSLRGVRRPRRAGVERTAPATADRMCRRSASRHRAAVRRDPPPSDEATRSSIRHLKAGTYESRALRRPGVENLRSSPVTSIPTNSRSGRFTGSSPQNLDRHHVAQYTPPIRPSRPVPQSYRRTTHSAAPIKVSARSLDRELPHPLGEARHVSACTALPILKRSKREPGAERRRLRAYGPFIPGRAKAARPPLLDVQCSFGMGARATTGRAHLLPTAWPRCRSSLEP